MPEEQPIPLKAKDLAEIILESAPRPMGGYTRRIDGSWAEPRGLECREVRRNVALLLMIHDQTEEYFHIEPGDREGWCRVWSPYWWRLSVERRDRQQAFSEAERQRRQFDSDQREGLTDAIVSKCFLDKGKDDKLINGLVQAVLDRFKENPQQAINLCKQAYGYELKEYTESDDKDSA